MKIADYLKSKSLTFIVHLICMTLLSCFLFAVGNTLEAVSLIILSWFMIVFLFYTLDYMQRNRYFYSLFSLLDHLDQRYLVGELMPDSFRIDDKKYRVIIR